MNKLRWGILGTAAIARKNWKAIRHSGNSVISAVASRDLERSKSFIASCQQELPFDATPVALGSYEELVKSPDVDAIYVPIPTGFRKEWVIRAAEAGKHVLCEKPCGATVSEVREMIDACRRNRVQFMDGVMFMHNPRMNRIRAELDEVSSFGKIRRITSQFCFFSGEEFRQTNIRSDSMLEPLGCLGDLGWYCIRFTLWAMNWQMPREVIGRILSQARNDGGRNPVPFDFSAEMIFDNDVSAGFFCSFLSSFGSWVTVTGTNGSLHVPDFVLPQKSSQGALEINGDLKDDLVTDPANGQDTNMIRAFAQQVSSGKLNEIWPEWSIKTQMVTNACLESALTGKPVALTTS
jgi:predicted dehydrogenase